MRKYRQNITEEELMEIFRKAAQSHEPFFDPKSVAEGWQTIESSLDRRRKPRLAAWWQFFRSYAWLLCLLILSGLLLAPIWINDKTVRIVHDHEAPNDRNVRHSLQQRVAVGEVPPAVEFHEQVLPAGSKPALYKTGTVQLMINDSAPAAHADHVTVKPGNTISITPTAPLGIIPLTAAPAPERKITAASLPQQSDTTAEKNAVKTPQKKYSRLSIHVLAATEWNKGGAGLSRLLSGGPGLTAGFSIQYRLSPRLSVETGLQLSNKRYNADSGSYKPSGNIYPNLLGVEADCHVIDIPVNLRYDLLRRNNQLIFARAGLSSFWMQKETYNITRLNNGAVDKYKLQLFNDNRHPFAVLNLGIGYGHQWKYISLQVGPYVKLPMTGIGHGDVKLMALGSFVSAGYRFNTKK